MKLYLDTSTPVTILRLDDEEYQWESKRDLAKHLLKFIADKLDENDISWKDITEIHFFSGPGSFTGLRIGAVVVNTLADQLSVPLYDHKGKRQEIILPEYGKPANTTAPKN
ncbi:MAG: tRNA (adenosine(37)-N6)-threonylcarbamoyltransferase complex dimerization subunit type 1 TsaB [Candidatus Saccharimonadales bacterium]